MVAYHLVDEVAEHYLDLIDALNDEIDELDDHVEDWPAEQVRAADLGVCATTSCTSAARSAPTRDAIRGVVDGRIEIDEERALPARGRARTSPTPTTSSCAPARASTSHATCSPACATTSQAKIANDQNEVVKRLTAIASLLLVPTFIVGVVRPELHPQHARARAGGCGYEWSWGLIIVTTIAQIVYFRRKRWL